MPSQSDRRPRRWPNASYDLAIGGETDGARAIVPTLATQTAGAYPNGEKSPFEPALIVILCAALLGLAGLLVVNVQSSVPIVLLAVSTAASFCAAIYILVITLRQRAQRDGATTDNRRAEFEHRIEALEDLRWQARDNADHLQALLDGQSDIIIRRDLEGRIIFANRAFSSAFNIPLTENIGKPFQPKTIERDAVRQMDTVDVSGLPVWARPTTERVRTRSGLRWIEWTHIPIQDADMDRSSGVQTIGRDITDQRKYEHELAAARDKARAADRAKSRFLASMSHEIRTPMNGILGMTGLLNETVLSAEQRTYTEAVRKSATTLLSLIDEILDFSKVESGHMELAAEPVDVVECLQSAVELLAPRAYQKRIELAWSLAPDMPRLYLGDEARLRQILLNLMGNAVKFTEEGGISVWLGAEPAEDGRHSIRIAIRDTGPGLTEEARARIFMEFERAVPVNATHESGTGLGLAIAQRLAQSMDGGISVVSRPGDGATFTLTVRLPEAPTDVVNNPAAGVSLAELRSLRGRHIVIVSTSSIERRTLANFLRTLEVAVTEVADVSGLAEALKGSQSGPPDTILFNSTTSPEQAEKALQLCVDGSTVRSAVIGSTANRADFDRFSNVGIDRFLVRPIRPSTLLALLTGEVDRSGRQEVLAAQLLETASGTQPETKRSVQRILVAEDNEINALLTRTVLTRLGCEPVMVPDGSQAVQEVARVLKGDAPAIDVILMDLHMPAMDGIEATAQIRNQFEAAGIDPPIIIAVTANAFQEDRKRCLAAGMDDYLSKPFEPGDLKRMLDDIAARRETAN